MGKILWPNDLAVLYPFPGGGINTTLIAAALIIISLISIYVFLQRFQRPYLLTGWLWYVITLIPVIGLVHVGSQRIADRYTYLPSIGIILMITWFISEFLSTKKYRRIISAVLCSGIIMAMVFMTQKQLSYWQSSITLYEHTLAVTSDNCIIENNLASELLKQKEVQQAYEHVTKSLSIWPENPWANANMAAILIQRNCSEEAMAYINKTLASEPSDSDALWHKGKILEMLQKNDEAIQAYEQCIQFNPYDAEAFNNLGVLKAKKGFQDQAMDCFRRAVKIKPHYTDANRNLAVLLQSKGQFEDAVGYYRNVLITEPDDYTANFAIASIFTQTGRLRESVDYYRHTIQIKSDYCPALNDLAWILAATTDPQIQNPQKAVELAQKACRLTDFRNPSFLDTLAVAYAADGQYDKAIETAQKGIELANIQKQLELALRMKNRLDLYLDSKPYYDPQPK